MTSNPRTDEGVHDSGGGLMARKKVCTLAVLAMIIAFGLISASTTSVSSSPAGSSLTAEVVDKLGEVKLTFTLWQAVLAPGQSLGMNLTVANIGNRTIGLWSPMGVGIFNFIVYNDSNSNLFEWLLNGVFFMAVFPLTLNPGDSFSWYLSWDQTCGQNGSSEGVRVSPGEYHIIGQLLSESTVLLQTEPLNVYISGPSQIQVIVIVGLAVSVPVVTLVAAALTRKK